jgi:hypothetical protein
MRRYLVWFMLVPCAVLALNLATAPAQDTAADVCDEVAAPTALADTTPPPHHVQRGVLWNNGPFIIGGDEVRGCPGDVDGDGDTDQSDLGALLTAWGTCVGHPDYNPGADFDASGCVDQADLGFLLGDWGCGT